MCGIAGTIFNNNFIAGPKVALKDIHNVVSSLDDNETNYDHLLDLAWKYKSNTNFLRFCKNKPEQSELAKLCENIQDLVDIKKFKISTIYKNENLTLYKRTVKQSEQLMDAHWFLSVEIQRWISTIENLSNVPVQSLDDSKIIFYKEICKVIHAIDNRLELRGRDSLGLSIVVNCNNSTNLSGDQQLTESAYHFFKHQGHESHTFNFKTFSSIGSLGDNATEIIKQIKSSISFNKIVSSTIINSATIMAHTRWASVGAVNIHNAHPISLQCKSYNHEDHQTFALLNGDIYNYKEIIDKALKEHKNLIESSSCTNDALAIPAYLLNKNAIDLSVISEMASDLSGSFVISLQHTSEPENIAIVKKGIQGLYLGFSDDGVMFASDVYGLVEACRYFLPVESNIIFNLSALGRTNVNNLNLMLYDQTLESSKTIHNKDLQLTTITTRDIDKRGFTHFLEKEIYETSDIVERTINGYLQPDQALTVENLHAYISMNERQVPAFILNSLVSNKIKKIVITGMGTCYTAAVAISVFMRSRLKNYIPDILVEPHIASEGSAFYLEPNMQDTLVIVIAQSGTTVDTNVYVQKAKMRGAMSLAIANKREGDVTFIVDGTIYIGEGRDIEIAVPSTKTYTAQVILGYILTLFFTSNLAKKDAQKESVLSDILNFRQSNKIIEDSFNVLDNNSSFNLINNYGRTHNSWYVIRDSSSNGVCADELRIKYSENCYQSVSSLSMSNALEMNIHNSFLTFITESSLSDVSEDIVKLASQGNSISIIVIDSDIPESLSQLIEAEKISILNMPQAPKFFTFLPTIIAGQFLSYFLAIALDDRKKYFVNLKNSMTSKIDFIEAYDSLELNLSAGIFTQGFSILEINKLSNYIQAFKKSGFSASDQSSINLDEHLEHLIQLSRRTIDTIKHQAKTITVGAVRENTNEQLSIRRLDSSSDTLSLQHKDAHLLNNIYSCFQELKLNDVNAFNAYDETFIAFEGIDEAFAYNIVNFINDFTTQLNIPKKVRLAHDYDYPSASSPSYASWIYLSNSKINIKNTFLNFLNPQQFLTFEFGSFDPSQSSFLNFDLKNSNNPDYQKAIWSLFLSIFLSNHLFFVNLLAADNSNPLLEKANFEVNKQLASLLNAISSIQGSSMVDSSIEYAAKIYLTRINWKAIGSGTNYNLAKFTSKKLISNIRRACAFDVLENHKHIDMSAESAVIVFISNIWRHGYQEDAFAEIEKLISHNSIPIIITNQGDDRYDTFSLTLEDSSMRQLNLSVPVIKLPVVSEQYSFALNILLIEKFVSMITTLLLSKDLMDHSRIAIDPPNRGMKIENFR